MDSERTARGTTFRRLRVGVAEAADGWRGILLAVIGGAVALLIAEALGDSDDGRALAALLGAAAGVVTHRLATRVRRDRTLSAVATVAVTLAVPGARRWAAERAHAGVMGLASSSAKAATSLGAAVLTAGVGTVSVLAVSSMAGPTSSAHADTPEAAIAEYLKDRHAEYVGSCAGRSQSEFDAHPRRVCSRPGRGMDGGRLFAIAQPGWLDQVPIVLLRHDETRGWLVVRCVYHC